MTFLASYVTGSGLMARIIRSASWVVLGNGTSHALRLASNLILTRILFPEAFGLMALISMVLMGLVLFSDVGLNQAIAQSKRGDDRDYLNTAWTVQVIRGVLLFGVACAVAGPIARFYEEPLLASLLPIASVTLLISAFNPTSIASAHRHLLLGRLTALDLVSQIIGLLVMVPAAVITQSVFALVLGSLVQTVATLILCTLYLPGERNKFRLEWLALAELFNFGKWIFLSTAFFFFSSQGDKAVLGKFLTLNALGIYNIGYFLASFPLAIGIQVAYKLLISVYRERPPHESVENFRKLAKMRHLTSFGLIATMGTLAMIGPWLVGVLYDDRYALAGGIIILVSVFKMAQAVGVTYDQVALAAGDSRLHFVFSASRATLQILFLFLGVSTYGLVGGLIGLSLAIIISHPMLIYLARKHKAWDPWHDAIWFTVVAMVSALAVFVNLEDVQAILPL